MNFKRSASLSMTRYTDARLFIVFDDRALALPFLHNVLKVSWRDLIDTLVAVDREDVKPENSGATIGVVALYGGRFGGLTSKSPLCSIRTEGQNRSIATRSALAPTLSR